MSHRTSRGAAAAAGVYVSGDIHTNTVEGFWSLVKRGIGGVYQSVSAKHLQGYMTSRQAIEPKLAGLYQRADSIMELLRIWQWDLEHGSDEDKEQARLEIAALREEMSQLLADFERTTGDLYAALDAMDAHFVTSPLHAELLVALSGYRSELNLLRINLVLRSGNIAEFDSLFRQYATDESIAPQVYVANAFRQLMDGDMRIALESVRRALERDPANATALQLRRDIELSYLERIRDQLAREMGENARLFNDKLNGHGSDGVGQFFVDVFTTAPAESALAVAGYYELLESVAGLNIDEAVSQIGGIRLLEDLLASGFALEELNSLSVDRIFEAYGNVDVNALRRGEVTQFNVDVGRDYFDTDVLQQGASDFVGLNAQELERGAYGAEDAMLQRQFVDAEVALDNVTLNSDGVAAARGAQLGFEGFEAELAGGGDDYLANLSAARRGLAVTSTEVGDTGR